MFSHAEEAGLKQGDFVVSVNGKEVGAAARAALKITNKPYTSPGVWAGPQGGVRPGHRGGQHHAHGHREVGGGKAAKISFPFFYRNSPQQYIS